MPGYVQTGFGASFKRVGGGIKGHFMETNDQAIDPYVVARADAVKAVGEAGARRRQHGVPGQCGARGGHSARAGGDARSAGSVASKDTGVLYQSLMAMQKIRDPSAGPKIAFLLNDLEFARCRLRRSRPPGCCAIARRPADLMGVLRRSGKDKVRRAALTSLAMLADPSARPVYPAVPGGQGRTNAGGRGGGLRAAAQSGGLCR